MSKKQYYFCDKCNYFSRFDFQNDEIKSAFSLFLNPLIFLHREKKNKKQCLNCGNTNIGEIFMEEKPSPLIDDTEYTKRRYVKCKKDKSVMRWDIKDNKPKCNICGGSEFEVFYKREKKES